MTTAPDVAVVATRLAQTDRRALSQAWYSALHLAHDAPHVAPHVQHPQAVPVPRAFSPGVAGRASAPPTRASQAPARRPAAAADGPPAERRGPLTAATRRLERALTQLAHGPRPRASQTVAIDGGRVRLLVRTDARATRIVAICSSPLQPAVERALAHARFALAAQGLAVRGS